MKELLASLPSVDRVARDERLAGLPQPIVVTAAREVIAALRAALLAGELERVGDVVPEVLQRAQRLRDGELVRVINATGVVVHTNLGRAPWAEPAIAAAMAAARCCNLELRLETGERGGRMDGVVALLRHLTGAESALVVNNGAAAVLLALTAIAGGRQVLVSRGELVEIGGSFRVPDVIASGGARLVEVGTTNRTRASDYELPAGPDAAALLRVHRSNFRLVGFTEEPDRRALAELAKARGLCFIEDLGSGSLWGEAGEPAVREVLAAGVELATFSGDKLLGGPQAGLIVGRAVLIDRLRKHPLYRALRVGKVTAAALEATLAMHARGERTPVQARLHVTPEVLAARGRRLLDAVQAAWPDATLRATSGVVGGGAVPGRELPSIALVLPSAHPQALARALRVGQPAIVPRVAEDAVYVELLAVADDEEALLAEAIAKAARGR